MSDSVLAYVADLGGRWVGRLHCATLESEVLRMARNKAARVTINPEYRRAFVLGAIAQHRENREVWNAFH